MCSCKSLNKSVPWYLNTRNCCSCNERTSWTESYHVLAVCLKKKGFLVSYSSIFLLFTCSYCPPLLFLLTIFPILLYVLSTFTCCPLCVAYTFCFLSTCSSSASTRLRPTPGPTSIKIPPPLGLSPKNDPANIGLRFSPIGPVGECSDAY